MGDAGIEWAWLVDGDEIIFEFVFLYFKSHHLDDIDTLPPSIVVMGYVYILI